jgi:hypothetical protein
MGSISPRLAYTLLVTVGFVSVSIPSIHFRALAPYVGPSVTAISLVDAVFLGLLALGLEYGGPYPQNPLQALQRNLLAALAIVFIGLFPQTHELLFVQLLYPLKINPQFSTSIYLVLVLSPMIYLLGRAVPILISYMRQNEVD